MAETLLIELLTEELPPKALQRLSQVFCDALVEDLRQDNLLAEKSTAQAYATPRRLAVSISNVLDKAPDQALEVPGPSAKVGLGADGKPTPALAGFAKKNGVTVDELVQIDTPKGKVFACRKVAAGAYLQTNLERKVEAALKRLPVPKMMRWGAGEAEFVRPVHGLVMMHGSRVVPGEVWGLRSTQQTRGHRFLSSGWIEIPAADQYEAVLEKQGSVIASFAKRRERVRTALETAAAGAKPLWNDALLDEVTALVEFPVVYQGSFSAEFLSVPQECLILSMQQHQKYFPLADAGGKLLAKFLVVSNLKTRDPANIIRGNERVLRARLADARFFFDLDRRTRLEERVPRLAKVVYHNKLGTQLDRTERVQLLAGKIARMLGADVALAERAAWLAKADLLTGMVGEFPELQGVMGRYYALHDGEPQEAANAIEAHYRPRFAGDRLPEGNVACAVALADKLETLAGMFGIGQQPSGDKDPFALRRHALGVIRVLVENNLALSLHDLVNAAFAAFPPGMLGSAHTDLQFFILERLRGYLRDGGYTANEVEAVLSAGSDKLDEMPRRLAAVRAFAGLPEGASLAAANKRVANILKQAEARGESFAQAEAGRLEAPAERELFQAIETALKRATPLFEQGDYTGYLKTFAILKSPVDAFFESVMVMVDDAELRKNRLALLADLRRGMNRVADISKLAA
jgi:glycyl-tRNA synthetase beta chain